MEKDGKRSKKLKLIGDTVFIALLSLAGVMTCFNLVILPNKNGEKTTSEKDGTIKSAITEEEKDNVNKKVLAINSKVQKLQNIEIDETKKEEEEKPEPKDYSFIDRTPKAYINTSKAVKIRASEDKNSEVVGILEDWQVVDLESQGETSSLIKTIDKNKQIANQKEDIDNSANFEEILGYVDNDYILQSTESTGNEVLISSCIIRHSSSKNRDYNIALACSKIDGLILKPDEEFNWYGDNGNDGVVGIASKEAGFKEAPIIVNHKSMTGYGGGVCQVATTVFNLINQVGIIPTKHFHHSIPSSYVKKGMDATVSWSDNPKYRKDFVFNNTLSYSIKFKIHEDNGNIYAELYRILN